MEAITVYKKGGFMKLDKVDWFILGMCVGGIMGIVIHAYITGTLFIQ